MNKMMTVSELITELENLRRINPDMPVVFGEENGMPGEGIKGTYIHLSELDLSNPIAIIY